MLRRAVLTACLLTLPAMTAVTFAPPAQAAERTKEELKALKKVMKKWSKALGVKCKHCHNTKDFKEWSAHREIGLAMNKLFTAKLKPLPGTEAVTCSDCHDKSLEVDEAKMAAFPAANLKALAADFTAAAEVCKEEEAKEALAKVAAYLAEIK